MLVIVNGMPGVGKTTLARRLSADTGLPQVSKDDLKEFFFDKIGAKDREWSRAIGKGVSQMLYPFTDSMLEAGYDLILESAFYKEFAASDIDAIVTKHNARCLEIYCSVEQEERHRRFVARNESGERHPGHVDALNYNASSEAADSKTYAPLDISERWDVDTLHFGDKEYHDLLRKLQTYIKEES